NGSSMLVNDPNQLQGTGQVTVTGTGAGILTLGTTAANLGYDNSGGLLLSSGTLQIAGPSATAAGWTASAAKALGNIVIPTAANGFYHEVTTAGTTGTTQPNFAGNTVLGSTLTDGGVTYTVRAAPNSPIGTGTLTIAGGTIRTDGTARTLNNVVNIVG